MAVMNLSTILTLIACVHAIKNSTSIRERIPEMLRILCPGIDVCHTNGSDVIRNKDSCCFHCSCESSCKDNGNCCFPDDYSNRTNDVTFRNNVQSEQTSMRENERNKQLGKHDERLWINGTRPQVECMYPSSEQPSSVKDNIRLQSFLMISSVKLYPDSSEAKTCGKVRVAPWGNMLPITSKRTGRIYKNPVCAEENNVTTGVLWKVVQFCKHYDEKTNVVIDTTAFVQGLEIEHIPEFCHAEFFPPQDMPVQRQDFCFKDLIDTCINDDFKIPAGLMLPQDAIVDACTSGLLSPFRSVNMYANVFCHICNGNKYVADMKCKSEGNHLLGTDKLALTALLEDDFVKDLTFGKKLKEENNLNKNMACKENGKHNVTDRCRRLLCSSGQLRNTEDDCVFPINSWINMNIIMHMQLVSDQPLLLNEYISAKYGNRKLNIISKLTSPWSKPWKVNIIYYKDLKSSETNELIVYLINTSPVIDAKRLLQNIKRTLKKTWVLNLNGTKFKLRQNFWKFLHINPTLLPTLLKNYSTNFKANYGYLYENYFLPRNQVSITKLSICEQVQLDVEEFSIIAGNLVLFNRISGKYLGNSEFTLLPVGSKVLARVCLADSGFTKVNSRGSSNHAIRWFRLLFLVLILSNS